MNKNSPNWAEVLNAFCQVIIVIILIVGGFKIVKEIKKEDFITISAREEGCFPKELKVSEGMNFEIINDDLDSEVLVSIKKDNKNFLGEDVLLLEYDYIVIGVLQKGEYSLICNGKESKILINPPGYKISKK